MIYEWKRMQPPQRFLLLGAIAIFEILAVGLGFDMMVNALYVFLVDPHLIFADPYVLFTESLDAIGLQVLAIVRLIVVSLFSFLLLSILTSELFQSAYYDEGVGMDKRNENDKT